MTLKLTSFRKALDSLQKVLALDKDDIIRDSAIHRFEYTYEIAWKLLQRRLREDVGAEQVNALSRKDLYRLAAERKLISDPQAWFEYHEARNLTVHTYAESSAEQVYDAATRFIDDAEALYRELERRND